MVRRLVFAGGPQTRALARIYRAEIGEAAGDEIVYMGPAALSHDTAAEAIRADWLVVEALDQGDGLAGMEAPAQIPRIDVPRLAADFLWPFAGRPHPRNRGPFPLQGGPYPAEHGDSFLDRAMAEGLSEDEAVARYLSLDIAAEAKLDDRLADTLERLAKLDQRTGFALAPFVSARFRDEALFISRERPALPLLRRVAAELFERLGADPALAEGIKRLPYPPNAQPLHPGVVRHFGLSYGGPARKYLMNDEGRFSFEAYCRRYLRFEWNEALHRGIQLADTDPAAAIPLLERGMAISPDSRTGRRALEAARRATALNAADSLPVDFDTEASDGERTETFAQVPTPAQEPPPQAPEPAPTPTPEPPPNPVIEPDPAPPPPAEPDPAPLVLAAASLHHSEPADHLDFAHDKLAPAFHGLADGADRPFAAIPESMPPPPLRPNFPPEAPAKVGFFGRLFGRK